MKIKNVVLAGVVLGAASSVFAAGIGSNTTMQAQVIVAPYCYFTAVPGTLDFGTVAPGDPIAKTATSSIKYNCNDISAPTEYVSIDKGLYGSTTSSRLMCTTSGNSTCTSGMTASTNTIQYNIYRHDGTEWGDTTNHKEAANSTTTEATLTVNGTITESQPTAGHFKVTGTYHDTVNVVMDTTN